MTPPPGRRRSPLFLQRRSYRRRRLVDAARFLPVLGLALWTVPLLWPVGGETAVRSSGALIYIFGVWALLVFSAFLLSLRLSRRLREDAAEGGE